MSAAGATATDASSLDYTKFGELAVESERSQSTTWGGRLWRSCATKLRTGIKVTQAVLGAGGFIVSTVLRTTVFKISKANPIGSTLSALGIGAGLQTFFDAILPREVRIILDQLHKDNALKVWFILTELFLIYNDTDAERKEVVLRTLTGYVGTITAAKIFDLIRKRAVDLPQNNGGAARAPILPEPNSKKALALYTAGKIAVGVTTAVAFRDHPVGIPLGIYIISDAVGFGAGFRSSSIPISNPNARSSACVGFVFLESTWGLFLALFQSPPSFVYGGLATGFTKFYRMNDAEAMPPNPDSQRRPIVSIINRVTDVAFVGFFVWWLVKNWPDKDSKNLGARVALGTCAAVLPTVAITKIFLNRYFKWGTHNRIVNSTNFYLQEYTVPASLVFAFVELYNGMGSRILSRGDLVTSDIVPAIGWTGYMTTLATSMTTSQPCSSLGLDGLTAGFIAQLLQNKL
jgi:hypothetical protein